MPTLLPFTKVNSYPIIRIKLYGKLSKYKNILYFENGTHSFLFYDS